MNTTTAHGKDEAGSQQVLTFVLGNETYGVDILRVQEIRGWSRRSRRSRTRPRMCWACSTCAARSCRSWTCACASASSAPNTTAITVIIVLSVAVRPPAPRLRRGGRWRIGRGGRERAPKCGRRRISAARFRHRVHPRPRAGGRTHGRAARHRPADRRRIRKNPAAGEAA